MKKFKNHSAKILALLLIPIFSVIGIGANAQYIDLDLVAEMQMGTSDKRGNSKNKNGVVINTRSNSGVTPNESPSVMVDGLNIKLNESSQQVEAVTQVGIPGGSFKRIRGSSKDIKFVDALKRVVPVGWRAKKVGNIDTEQLVEFKGWENWLKAIQSFSSETDTVFIVNWDTKIITVKEWPTETVDAMVMVAENGNKDDLKVSIGKEKIMPKPSGPNNATNTVGKGVALDTTEISVGNGVVKVSVMEEAPPPPKWYLRSGISLRENIQQWVSVADPKYKLEWQAVNYMIEAGAIFQGVFNDEKRGPIAAIIKLFEQSDVPLKATFLENNKVLLVENAAYKQGFSDLNK